METSTHANVDGQETKPTFPHDGTINAEDETIPSRDPAQLLWEITELRKEIFRHFKKVDCLKYLTLSKYSHGQMIEVLYRDFSHSDFQLQQSKMVAPSQAIIYYASVRKFTIRPDQVPGSKWTYARILRWFPQITDISFGAYHTHLAPDQSFISCTTDVSTGFMFDQNLELPVPVPPLPAGWSVNRYNMTLDASISSTPQPFPWGKDGTSSITIPNFLELPIARLTMKGQFTLAGLGGMIRHRRSNDKPPIIIYELECTEFSYRDLDLFMTECAGQLRHLSLRAISWPSITVDELGSYTFWEKLQGMRSLEIEADVFGNQGTSKVPPEDLSTLPRRITRPGVLIRPLHLESLKIRLVLYQHPTRDMKMQLEDMTRCLPRAEDIAGFLGSIGGPLCNVTVSLNRYGVAGEADPALKPEEEKFVRLAIQTTYGELVARELRLFRRNSGPVGWEKVEKEIKPLNGEVTEE